jgi:hypothetical protein
MPLTKRETGQKEMPEMNPGPETPAYSPLKNTKAAERHRRHKTGSEFLRRLCFFAAMSFLKML